MTDERTDKEKELGDEVAKLLGQLIVGRRDAYAFHNGKPGAEGQWIAKRQPFKKSDFYKHLYGNRCLGAYLLDADSMVRCIAFDIDLKDDCDYFVIRDIDDIERMEAAGAYDAEFDPDIKHHGNLEAALHDRESEAHRWACMVLTSTMHHVMRAVTDALQLKSLPIITGGGAHVFVPFGELLPAAEARAMAHGVMEEIPIYKRRSESFYHVDTGAVEIEVFPKQDSLPDPESLGNLIRLPFGLHESGVRSFAFDPTLPLLPSYALPKRKSMSALREAAESVGVMVG